MAIFGMLPSMVSAAPIAHKEFPEGRKGVLRSVPSDDASGRIANPRHQANFATPSDGFIHITTPGTELRRRAARSASAAARTLAESVDVVAQVNQTTTSSGLTTKQFYYLPHATGQELVSYCTSTPVAAFNYGGYYLPDSNHYLGMAANVSGGMFYGGTIYEIDLATGETVNRIAVTEAELGLLSFVMDTDPVSGRTYGQFYAEDGQSLVWGYVDYTTKTRVTIKEGTFDDMLQSLGCDRYGQYYGVTYDGELVKVNKETGNFTFIADTQLPAMYDGASAINHKNHTLLAAVLTENMTASELYEIDLTTGATTLIASFPEAQWLNMFVLSDMAADKAPDAPILTMSAPEGTMTVDYTITLPTTLFDGTPITGAVDWKITEGGTVVFEGRNMAGSSVSGSLTLETAGMKHFEAVAINAEGESAPAKVDIYVGHGTPASPADVVASYADGVMTITWQPVTESGDGGYIVADEVTYSVISEDGILLAKNITETQFSYSFTAPVYRTGYTYRVLASYDGKSSADTYSNTVFLGGNPVPFRTDFNSADVIADQGYTIIDANGDGDPKSGNYMWSYDNDSKSMIYKFSYSKIADDWLVTPAMHLEAGKAYLIDIQSWSGSTAYAEKFEVMAGKECTPEGMATTVIPATEIKTGKDLRPVTEGVFAPTEDGDYYIGIHCISKAFAFWFHVDWLEISAPFDQLAPTAATELTLTPDSSGSLSCSGSFVTPTTYLSGEEIPTTEKVHVELLINDVVWKTFDNKPGYRQTFYGYSSQFPTLGTYKFTVRTSVNGVEGPSAEQSAFVGPYAAAAPAKAEFFETNQPGTVTMLWDAVTTDKRGTSISSSYVTYQAYRIEDGYVTDPMLPEPVKATRATFKGLEDPTKQDFVQFAVGAYNRDAEPEKFVASNTDVIGRPYSMPVGYSNFADLDQHLMGVAVSGASSSYPVEVAILNNEIFDDEIDGYDDHEFFAMIFTKTYGQTATLLSGKIDLTSAAIPELVFSMYHIDDLDVNPLDVIIVHNNTETKIATVDHSGMLPGWNKLRFRLKDFVGENIQVKLVGSCKKYQFLFLDAINIRETWDKDMAITNISAPVNAKIDEPFSIYVEVENQGLKTAPSFTVNLYRDGDLFDTREAGPLEPEDQLTVVFDDVIGQFDLDSTQAVYSAEVVYEGDSELDNNSSRDAIVNRPASNLPAVNDLVGEVSEGGVSLRWSVFDASNPIRMTEDFEDAEPFADTVDNWTMLDLDKAKIGSMSGMTIPGHASGTVCSFFVMDNANEGIKEKCPAASGTKTIATVYSSSTALNDWAISPLLSGEAQTVTFMAKSYDKSFLDHFRIMVTTEDSVDPDDYEELVAETKAPIDWTEFSFDIEEGVKHFAIVSCAKNQYMLFIDDVTFTPDPSVNVPTLIGYDVYRNGHKITAEPVNAGEYFDANSAVGLHNYHVVAVYNEGSSELSNLAAIEIEDAGIGAVVGDTGAIVSVENHDIVIANSGMMAVAVATVDGKLLHSGLGDVRLTVAPGIYLATVGTHTVKLLVR